MFLGMQAAAHAQLWAQAQKDQRLSPPRRPVPVTFFCTHAPLVGPQQGATSPPLRPENIAGWPGAGYRIFGGMPPCQWTPEKNTILGPGQLCWGGVEYEKGIWRWEITDTGLRLLHRNLAPQNVGLLVNLKGIPPWAAANPDADGLVWSPNIYRGSSSYPRNQGDWQQYLTRLVTRYRGVVQYYETPNEANHEMKLAPQEILETNRTLYQTVKRLDPHAKVVGPATAGTDTMAEWTGEYMKLGGKEITDIVSCHFYGHPESVVTRFARVKEELIRAGAGDKPIWNTESGFFADSQEAGGPDRDAASRRAKIVRSALLQWAVGIERWYLFGDVNGASDKQAYAVAQRWMAGGRMLRCEVKHQIWECEMERRGKRSLIVWAGPRYPFQLEANLEYPAHAVFQAPSRFRSMETLTGTETPLTTRAIVVSSAPIILKE